MVITEAKLPKNLIERTAEEVTVDRFLLMFLISTANKIRSLWGKTKLEKLVYCSQYGMMKTRIKGFNYYFYRWHFGPYSEQVYEDLAAFSECGFVAHKVESGEIAVTPKGLRILHQFDDVINDNAAICAIIRETAEDYKEYSADKIKEAIYETLVFGSKKTYVRDVDMGDPLLHKLPKEEAKTVFKIESGKVETLWILFAPKFYEQILRARADRVVLPYTPLK